MEHKTNQPTATFNQEYPGSGQPGYDGYNPSVQYYPIPDGYVPSVYPQSVVQPPTYGYGQPVYPYTGYTQPVNYQYSPQPGYSYSTEYTESENYPYTPPTQAGYIYYPPVQPIYAYNPFTQKKILKRGLTPEQLRQCIEADAARFGDFVISQLTDSVQSQDRISIFNITSTRAEDNGLIESLSTYLRNPNTKLPPFINIYVNGAAIKPRVEVVLPTTTQMPPQYDFERSVFSLFEGYETQKGDNHFEIVPLSLPEQIEVLSQNNPSQIGQTELIAWQQTLQNLLATAKPNEMTQIEEYVEKTQVIIEKLNGQFQSIEERKNALMLAVSEFNRTIKPLSEKDQAFKTGLKFSTVIILTVIAAAIIGGLIGTNPVLLIWLPVMAIVVAVVHNLGYLAAAKYANHEICQADSPGLVSKALGKLGIFSYTPYKHTALEFSKEVIKEQSPPSDPSQQASAQGGHNNLTPVYQKV